MEAPGRALQPSSMIRDFKAEGYTLLEITAALVLFAVAASAALPRLDRALDGFAVRSARERVAGLAALARARAPGLGGAWVLVREAPGAVRVEARDTVLVRLGEDELDGVQIEVAGARTEAIFHYDALGVGRVASGALRFRRGDRESSLVISSYGRIHRR